MTALLAKVPINKVSQINLGNLVIKEYIRRYVDSDTLSIGEVFHIESDKNKTPWRVVNITCDPVRIGGYVVTLK